MRASLAKLIETCQLVTPSMSGFLGGLEASGWVKHVRSVLETASFITGAVAGGASVLVHCSDGWDRTSQTCALAQLLLDPYYRTLRGFQILIEKEWLAFGHKFTDRCGHIQGDSKEVAPIFTQFIDCVWQLLQILPSAFEFNERYLLILHDHVFSSQFGTFIGNCQKDRVDLRLSERTYSLWGYISSHEREYRNPLYRKDSTADVLRINLCPQSIRFWRGMYNRFENGVHPREPLGDLLAATTEHTQSLSDQADFLTKRITWLKGELERSNSKKGIECDNRILENAQQNGENEESEIGSKEGVCVLGVSEIEESLVSVGALTLGDEGGGEAGEVVKVAPDATFINPSHLVQGTRRLSAPLLRYQSEVCVCPAVSSVALDWRSFRNIRECSCSTPFDHFSRKHHCWRCGEVFCTRCIDKKAVLPGHLSLRPAPVCHPCYKDITRSVSVDTP
ncbi:hypothetical protein Pcinc_038871 [Petrolisthes cinctipes]|uniref:phosphatidylinositol-3,5-bisphosphate 3-phosphatase n=1 Tax=Petrolisthes cinctipes TaxID=88211 RepID=A0AAE1EML1_PETCI|nr:hypothetical protein Pcinc_038871 [Petrolisthes cinctipes]